MFLKLTGACLALLISNPFCCCLTAGELEAAEAEEDAHACCHVAEMAGGEEAPPPPEDQAPCECEGELERPLMVEKGMDGLEDTQWKLLASVAWVLSAGDVMPVESERGWAGVESPVPPGKRVSQVYCVYRL
jgi:hypothetical protein